MISALEETEQGKECRERWLQGPVFSYFQGFHAEDILERCQNTSSLSLSSKRPCDYRDCHHLPPPPPQFNICAHKKVFALPGCCNVLINDFFQDNSGGVANTFKVTCEICRHCTFPKVQRSADML